MNWYSCLQHLCLCFRLKFLSFPKICSTGSTSWLPAVRLSRPRADWRRRRVSEEKYEPAVLMGHYRKCLHGGHYVRHMQNASVWLTVIILNIQDESDVEGHYVPHLITHSLLPAICTTGTIQCCVYNNSVTDNCCFFPLYIFVWSAQEIIITLELNPFNICTVTGIRNKNF